jgi:hypothetical protein
MLRLEHLESRRLMTTAWVQGNTLNVLGTNGDDNIVLSQSGSQLRVDFSFEDNGHLLFPATGVTKFLIDGVGGNDDIAIDSFSGNSNGGNDLVMSTISGGAGDDALHIGYGTLADIRCSINVDGGNGADSLEVSDGFETRQSLYAIKSDSVKLPWSTGAISYQTTEHLQVVSGNANDQVAVKSTAANVSYVVTNGGGTDAVWFTDAGKTQGINGSVDVSDGFGSLASIMVDNSAGGPLPGRVTLDGTSLAGITPAPVTWEADGITGIDVKATAVTNPVNWSIHDTPNGYPSPVTTLHGSGSTDHTDIYGTTGRLSILNSGTNFVTVGQDFSKIAGDISLDSGHVALTLDDRFGSDARDIRIGADANGALFSSVGGPGIGNIHVAGAELGLYSLKTGIADDRVTVNSNPSPGSIDTWGGNDTIRIGDASSPASAAMGQPLTVYNTPPGDMDVIVDDTADMGTRSVQVRPSGSSAGVILNIGAQPLTIATSTLDKLAVLGSSAANAFDISASPAFGRMEVTGGPGRDTFTVTNTVCPTGLYGGDENDTFIVNGNDPNQPVEIESGNGDDIVRVNADNVGSAKVTFNQNERLDTLQIGAGGGATMLTFGTHLLNVRSLSIDAAGGGWLDLRDNDMVVPAGSLQAINNVRAWLASGRNGGAWNGPGIRTANASINKTLAMMDEREWRQIRGNTAAFDGFVPINGTAIVKYTYYGDADFNGRVNFDDYVRTDNGFNNHRSGWVNGDFDGNGQVNFDDYVLIDLAFNTQSGTLRRR